MRNLADANLMGGAAKVKEAVMNAAAAAHQHVAGDAGVKAAGDQRQHIFLGADRETADAFIAAFHQQQAIVFNLEIDGDVRVGQLHARRFNMLIQTAADVAFHFN